MPFKGSGVVKRVRAGPGMHWKAQKIPPLPLNFHSLHSLAPTPPLAQLPFLLEPLTPPPSPSLAPQPPGLMSTQHPIFPMPEPHHFSDYGFDPQIDYFQVLEEARKHKREARSIDSLHFKLQKPISKDDSKKGGKMKKKRWWKSALLFFKWKWTHSNAHLHRGDGDVGDDEDRDVHRARARAFRASISGPVYITEGRSGSSTPYRTSSRPSSGPLARTLTPDRRGEVEIPYLSLRELNLEQQQHQRRISTSTAMPIYLVT